LEVVADIAKHVMMNSEPWMTTVFFDTSSYLFLLLLEISRHCL